MEIIQKFEEATEGVIDAVIVPALTKLGFHENNITVAHRMPQPGSINRQLIQRILEDDLVITNLTNLNPNVMYELAVRHCSRKPVIQICEEGTKLPFDIVEERTIFYKNDMLGTVQLSANLTRIVPEALTDSRIDNPIYRVIESNLIQTSDTIVDSDKYIARRLNEIEKSISELATSQHINNNFSNNLAYRPVVDSFTLEIQAYKGFELDKFQNKLENILYRDYEVTGVEFTKGELNNSNIAFSVTLFSPSFEEEEIDFFELCRLVDPEIGLVRVVHRSL